MAQGQTVFLVYWHHEVTWTGGGDPQPDMVLAVSCFIVAAFALAVVAGLAMRRRLWRPRT